MPEDQAGIAARSKQMRPHTLVLWVLFLGLVVSFAMNVTQDKKIDSLTLDLAALRQENLKQIAELRDAQSASLEQDLLRLDQLATELQKSNQDELHQAASLANRTRAELARTMEQRHQEMITAISDLRADLRSEANVGAAQLKTTQQVQTAHREALPGGVESDSSVANAASHLALTQATLVSEEKNREEQAEQPTPSATAKKGFWSRLNPFSRRSPRTSNPAN
jgi:hypothetical protein